MSNMMPVPSLEAGDLFNGLVALRDAAVALQRQRSLVSRVDGVIIGTGEADFTKGNSCYQLRHQGKPFQLMDVPGIEGDETRYAGMVREAIAKAHMVLYVNGTNKKPETTTILKIKEYLRRGTRVCTLVNVRGNADTYEFEEDRRSLTDDGANEAPLQSTEAALEAALGADVLLPGYCVQGLLAFAGLAVDASTGRTTIHPSRNGDLVVQQRNYLKYFRDPAAMRRFSRIDDVAQILGNRVEGFREEIIESNKAKVRELLVVTLRDLRAMMTENEAFMGNLEPEFVRVRKATDQNVKDFADSICRNRKAGLERLFNAMLDNADGIIKDHFGDNEAVNAECEKSFNALQQDAVAKDRTLIEGALAALQDHLQRDVGRFLENLQRIDFQHRVEIGTAGMSTTYRTLKLDMGIGFDTWSKLFAKTWDGGLSGFHFGPWGAIAGAVLKLIFGVVELFMGKEKRIRMAQAQAHGEINAARQKAIADTAQANVRLLETVKTVVAQSVTAKVEELHTSLRRPRKVIRQQIAAMENALGYLEKMPHGTIQPIQR